MNPLYFELCKLIAGPLASIAGNAGWKWFYQKLGKDTNEIQKALLDAHYEAVQLIRESCEATPQWESDKDQIQWRLDNLKHDGEEILGIVEAEQQPGIEGSFDETAQKQVTINVMSRLKSQDKWLNEAPVSLSNMVERLYVPLLVHKFRVKIKQKEEVFRTVIYDMLVAVKKDTSSTEQLVEQIYSRLGRFIASYGEDINQILESAREVKDTQQEHTRLLHELKGIVAVSTLPIAAIALDWRRKGRRVIADKTKFFVGRRYVFNKIDEFLNTEQNGYFIIQADPGMGKSSVLSKYVLDNDCVVHFNRIDIGITEAHKCQESLCTQLINRFQLNYQTVSAEDASDGAMLENILEEVSKTLKGNKLVIAVDALDEVDLDSQKARTNILYLPSRLPEGVYFVMTKQPIDVPLVLRVPKGLLDMTQAQYFKDNRNDVEAYIKGSVNRSQDLGNWISNKNMTTDDFINELALKSENNFMYLSYVLPAIAEEDYPDLTLKKLPSGLESYYEFHWNQVMGGDDMTKVQHKILYVLTKFSVSITSQQLAKFARVSEYTIQTSLKNWRRFVPPSQDDGEDRKYKIYHTGFRRFIERQNTVQKSGINLQEINEMIADEMMPEEW